ncbi:POZ domain-containing protein [Auriscalpium vulgare]|uniref:POZ domain-containing protein n=1 Tax=Auriscalpium vulgare TaxID=40419 RepID=A0ACB8RVQ1_9AGAM|nr:POZ domain-containing protein [Auriscalpium vulgare]
MADKVGIILSLPREVHSTTQNAGDDDWVRVTSTDGFSFLVKRKVAVKSGTLKSMLDEDMKFAEAAHKTCTTDNRSVVTEKFLEYIAWKATYENAPPKEEIPDFFERIPPEVALELCASLYISI